MPRRALTHFEVGEARLVFASSLDTTVIVLHEQTAWPDHIAAIGAGLRGESPSSHNAVTLGNHMYFPVELGANATVDTSRRIEQMAWLIHELTHCWQFQHEGIMYFFKALWAQLRLGTGAYAYGWTSGLEQAILDGKRFSDFNPEQQGEITRHFYYRLKHNLDTGPWLPWIQVIQATGSNPA